MAVRIRNAREQAGLTRFELAQRIGITTRTAFSYWGIETGSQAPTVIMLFRIATALGVDPRELLP